MHANKSTSTTVKSRRTQSRRAKLQRAKSRRVRPAVKRTSVPRPNGYVLHADSKRVVIATGFSRKSENAKTGNMIQLWILPSAVNPVEAKARGLNSLVCGKCPLIQTCYVNLGQAPLSVYRAWKRGSYPQLSSFDMFDGRAVRLGAYGDPAFVPLPIIAEIVARARKHTGYTHQWRNAAYAGLKAFVMASVESEQGAQEAHAQGWRTFRVGTNLATTEGEIVCLNTTRGITCEQCGLCNGASKAKSILIAVHGTSKRNFSEVSRA